MSDIDEQPSEEESQAREALYGRWIDDEQAGPGVDPVDEDDNV